MKNYVITIARGYGSGGKTIGKMLSRELDIEYYDRELLRRASDESGISEHLFAQADEKLKSKGPKLLKVRRSAYTGQLLPPGSEDFTSYQNLFNYQAIFKRKNIVLKKRLSILGQMSHICKYQKLLQFHVSIIRVWREVSAALYEKFCEIIYIPHSRAPPFFASLIHPVYR